MTDPTDPSGQDPAAPNGCPPESPADPAEPSDRDESNGRTGNDAQAPHAQDAPSPATETSDNEHNGRKSSGGKGRSRITAEPKGPTLVARYGAMRHIGEFRHNLDAPPPPGRHVVVRTDNGVELGKVVSAVHRQDTPCGSHRVLPGPTLQAFLEESGPEYPFRRNGRVLRLANPQDMIEYRHLQDSAKEAAQYCRDQIRQRKLPMKLVTVEHLLGGERIVFYFTAEKRVDFRELVRTLASQFRTRIEMRQVGARDEARLVADYERCGQRCCCQEFLKHLKPVSMRMAKVQKATLDPSKISGRCGRLMCCLRYEDQTYSELRKTLPKRNTFVRAGEVVGKVLDSQIITQLVRLLLPDNTLTVIGVDEITERNVQPPEPRQASAPPRRDSDRKSQQDDKTKSARSQDDSRNTDNSKKRQEHSSSETTKTQGASGENKPKKKRRRRKKRKPSGNQGGKNN